MNCETKFGELLNMARKIKKDYTVFSYADVMKILCLLLIAEELSGLIQVRNTKKK